MDEHVNSRASQQLRCSGRHSLSETQNGPSGAFALWQRECSPCSASDFTRLSLGSRASRALRCCTKISTYSSFVAFRISQRPTDCWPERPAGHRSPALRPPPEWIRSAPPSGYRSTRFRKHLRKWNRRRRLFKKPSNGTLEPRLWAYPEHCERIPVLMKAKWADPAHRACARASIATNSLIAGSTSNPG